MNISNTISSGENCVKFTNMRGEQENILLTESPGKHTIELEALSNMDISHNELDNWRVEAVIVSNSNTKVRHVFYFPKETTTSGKHHVSQHDVSTRPSIVSRLEAEGGAFRLPSPVPNPLESDSREEYEIKVKTGDVKGATTKANLQVKFIGIDGDLAAVLMADQYNRFNSSNFEQNKTASFLERSINIGYIKAVEVELMSSASETWFLEWISLRNTNDANETLFEVNRWFGKNMEDGEQCRLIDNRSQSHAINKRQYEILVVTSADQFAGTDRDIYIVLHGEEGSTKPIHLKSENLNSFDPGSRFEISVVSQYVGNITSIVIGFFVSESEIIFVGKGWKLSHVIVNDVDGENAYHFKANQWLSPTYGECRTMMEFATSKTVKRKPKVHYLVEIVSTYLPDNDQTLEPYIEVVGPAEWTAKQYLKGNNQFRLDKAAKFKFVGINVDEVKRIRFGIDGVKQLKSEYNNATVEPCWIVDSLNIKLVRIKNDKLVDLIGSYCFSERIEFHEQRLVYELEPDSTPADLKSETVKFEILLKTDRRLNNMDEYAITIFSQEKNETIRSTGKFVLYRSLSYLPVTDSGVLVFGVYGLEIGEIEKIEFSSGGNESFVLGHVYVKVLKHTEEIQTQTFVTNYEFFQGSKPIMFYPEQSTKIDYEVLFTVSDATVVEEGDEFFIKIFNENDFVLLQACHFDYTGRNIYRFACENTKIGAIEGIEFLDRNAFDALPEWHIKTVEVKSSNYSYDFYTDLFLPNLRYERSTTKAIYMNSLTAALNSDSLKLEIITGQENFYSVYTILTLEFKNLEGDTTGQIEIPAEEYKPGQHKIYNIEGVKLWPQHPISVVKINCPNRLLIDEVKVFNPVIHKTSESFIINHWFPGEKMSTITAKYSKFSCSILTSNRENAGISNTVLMQCFDKSGNSSLPIECGSEFRRGSKMTFSFDMKSLAIARIVVWQDFAKGYGMVNRWHLEAIQLIDQTYISPTGKHRKFYNFFANQWITDIKVELQAIVE